MYSQIRAAAFLIAVVLPLICLGAAVIAVEDAESQSSTIQEPQDTHPTQPLREEFSSPDLTSSSDVQIPQHEKPPVGSFLKEFRTIDGRGNNISHPLWGNAPSELIRITVPDYPDTGQVPSGQGRLSPRVISNVVVAQDGLIPNPQGVSDFVWQWGQFLDHDMDLTPILTPPEAFDILVPTGDPFFDPSGTGTVKLNFFRSAYSLSGGIRQQINEITAFIDASNVYGSDSVRAEALRLRDGTGQLKTSPGRLLPLNTLGLPNAPSSNPNFFLAGDFRANEQVGLTAMHTLFVREHNYWADYFKQRNPSLGEDDLYQMARLIVAAEMQAITYNEFLPVLLGPHALARYQGYQANVNPGISNEFASAAYRFGHSMLSPVLLLLDQKGNPVPEGPLPLAQAFFNPKVITDQGIEPLLRGLAFQVAQNVDAHVVDGVRNFLFGAPGSGGSDLASMNIQRGRDHGIPSYNKLRSSLGLPRVSNFGEITSDLQVQRTLAQAYNGEVEDLDLWVGGLAEDHAPNALVGPTFLAILKDQFERLRDGDRFWYQQYLPAPLVRIVEQQTLATIIRRNTRIGLEIRDNVFIVPTGGRSR